MKFISGFIFILCSGFSVNNTATAADIKHEHNGRVHSHALPKTGLKHFHKHMHNGRAHIHPYSAKVGFKHSHNVSPRAKAWANAIRHDHDGRPHSHPLPRNGLKHQHSHRHGGRSHIHPFPVNDAPHFHQLGKNQGNSEKNISTSNNPRILEGFSVEQQMALLSKSSILKSVKGNSNSITRDKNNTVKKKAKKVHKKRIRKKSKKTVRLSTKQKSKKTKQSAQQIISGNRQYNLGLRYENGTGVEKNLSQAFNWYERAAKNGDKRAKIKLNDLVRNKKQ